MFFQEHNNDENWYIMLVRVGSEKSVKEQILRSTDIVNLKDMIIPEPPTNGVLDQAISKRYKMFLGYVFVKVNLNLSSYNVLIRLNDVYRFLGSISVDNNKNVYYIPKNIPEKQIVHVKEYLQGHSKHLKKSDAFQTGNLVKIKFGDLSGIKGKIIEKSGNYVSILPKTFFTQTIKVSVDNVVLCDE